VGLAKVLISAPVMPPSPWRGFKTFEPLGFGVILEVLIFATYGWPVPELTMEDTVQPSTSCRAIALERFFPYVGCHTTPSYKPMPLVEVGTRVVLLEVIRVEDSICAEESYRSYRRFARCPSALLYV